MKGINDYAPLFKGLDKSVQLEELIIGKTERIFYFTKLATVYIVAITKSHFETDKNRR